MNAVRRVARALTMDFPQSLGNLIFINGRPLIPLQQRHLLFMQSANFGSDDVHYSVFPSPKQRIQAQDPQGTS